MIIDKSKIIKNIFNGHILNGYYARRSSSDVNIQTQLLCHRIKRLLFIF
jgi:hypothetical protein